MPEVLWLTRDDARRLESGEGEELAVWPEGTDSEGDEQDWRIVRMRVRGPEPVPTLPGCERIRVVTGGAGMMLQTDGGGAVPLRPLEPLAVQEGGATTLRPMGGEVEALEVLVRRGRARAVVEVLRLGARRARETIGPGHAFVHALHGAAQARVTGEEEPFELEPGDSLWVRDLRDGEELDLAGEEQGTVVLLVRLSPTTS
jgi:environmental stress-induced protein Ves